MKKFISLLIASAMVVSLVPATAFAGDDVSATAKVVGKQTIAESDDIDDSDYPELQIKVADASYTASNGGSMDFEVTLDNAAFIDGYDDSYISLPTDARENGAKVAIDIEDLLVNDDGDELTFTLTGNFQEDDVIIIELATEIDDNDAGDECTVSIDCDMVEADDLVFVTVAEFGIEASVDDIVYVAEDESVTLDDLVVEESVSGTFGDVQILKMELSKGFVFDNTDGDLEAGVITASDFDDEYAYFELTDAEDEIEFVGLEIYSDSASEGDVCEIEITLYSVADDYADFDDDYSDSAKSKYKVAECEVEVAEVCEYTVTISVDEDEDVPVFYSGVNSENFGLNDDGDHVSLEITIAESFPGAWSYRDQWELTLPEGVYVVVDGVEFEEHEMEWDGGNSEAASEAAFEAAYVEGDYESFVFKKRTFSDNESDDEYELTFTLKLVADYGFEGEVVLGFVGDSVNEDEVVIAEFVSPFTVEASQNDLIIDYRNTPVNTPIIITEAEAELWSDDFEMGFVLDDNLEFDSTGTIEVDSDSDMEIDDERSGFDVGFEVDEESDDEAAVITITDIELYMSRSLPAGAYTLDVATSLYDAFLNEEIYAAEGDDYDSDDVFCVGDVVDGNPDDYDEYEDYSVEVCENFVNIVTAGSDQATTFTTKVIVPIGEYYIYSGGTQIELDVPAYISADGYTMLPVRAVATAIGVSTSNVLWDSATQQVTIIYGTKTIAMVIGQSYMTVNGTAIPTSACPEIVDGRTFLPLRDLATALSVTDISWDADTRTASLN